MDIVLDDIITGVKGVKDKVRRINDAQDVINEKTGKASKKVDTVSNRIKSDN